MIPTLVVTPWTINTFLNFFQDIYNLLSYAVIIGLLYCDKKNHHMLLYSADIGVLS